MRRKSLLLLLLVIFPVYDLVLTGSRDARSEDNKMVDESMSKKLREYEMLNEKLLNSRYVIEGGKVVWRGNGMTLPSEEAMQLEIIGKAIDAIGDKIALPEGAKAFVLDEEDQYIVVIGMVPPKATRRADYIAKVVVDKGSGKVIKILAGS